ncbi:hypothetical protein [Desulfovibrio sp. UCD-KL4C]|uniref:hypothetical protein n=1 Tax=Desulfovibrio sp. UCD-KL4C TaxID=2578120 RepID=UPI0025C3336B|nr:hypothetical protein [Desulfovibrio sp. UCD-KL4C]
MKIFLESSSLEEIKNALDFKLIDGVDFNLDLPVFKEMDHKKHLSETFKMIHGPCMVNTSEKNSQGILGEAKQVVGLGLNAVIKIPTTKVIMSGRVGGEFVNLELSGDSQEEGVGELVSIYKKYNFESTLMISGFTKLSQVNEAIKAGIGIISVSYEVLINLV